MASLDVLQTFPWAVNVLACQSNIGLEILTFVWSVIPRTVPGMTLKWPVGDN